MIRPVCRYLHHVPGKPRSFFRAGGSGQEKRRGQEHKCRDAPHCWLSQLTDDAVAGCIEDAAPVSFDQLIDDGAASLQPGERVDLVSRHQPAVAGNVSGEDRGEFALYRMDRHAWLLPGAVYRPARLERELSSAERLAKGEIEPDGPLLIAATRCR
jgi:hypothetical protein